MITLKAIHYQTGKLQEVVLMPETQPTQDCSIGRIKTCDLFLESSDVSRTHAKIQIQNDSYSFIDLGSANGSRINGQRAVAHQNYLLEINDLIQIGDFVLRVEAIDFPASEDATASISQRLDNDVLAEKLRQREWSKGNLTVHCVRITQETADVKTFTFVADPPVQFHYQPGQFVTLDLDIDGESVLRSYSISSAPSRPHTLEITVKRVAAPSPNTPAGLVSNWLHDHLNLGDPVKLTGPFGKFTCAPHPADRLLMISAGSGITPMMSMSRWISDRAIPSDIVFFHSARTPRDIIFRTELEIMSARLPNFHLALATTQPTLGDPWYGFTGRLTETTLRSIAPDFPARQVYVCGPAGFMHSTRALLETLNFPMSNYFEESFGAPQKSAPAKTAIANPLPAAVPAAVPAAAPAQELASSVLFSRSGQQVESDGSESILELAEQVRVKIRSSCKQGVCGACKQRKLEGEVSYDSEPDALNPDDHAAGYILPCVATAVGRVVIEA
ncbi:MAG TPA: FAD-binding oxidoreductase [Coleofasciculaceae cyanobacterium]